MTFLNHITRSSSFRGRIGYFDLVLQLFYPLKVAWMNPKKILISQGDRRLMDDIRMTIERPLVPDWNLHIRTVRFSDRGMYTCTLNTKPVLIKRIDLTVLGIVIHCW